MTIGSNPSQFVSFDQFQSNLHQAWRKDRILRQRVDCQDSWRGVVGLGLIVASFGGTLHHGEHQLIDNDLLTWIAIRDVPAGHFPAVAKMNNRDVDYVSLAKCTLKFGMPQINFAHPAHAVMGLPAAGAAKIDQVANAISGSMTYTAFYGLRNDGTPLRRPWAAKRPLGNKHDRPFRLPVMSQWLPVPYLAFPFDKQDQIYGLATETAASSSWLECPKCRRRSDLESFKASRIVDGKVTSPVVIESGDFFAVCPNCNTRRKWHLADAQPCHISRKFSDAFRANFCRDLANGMPLRMTEGAVYQGVHNTTHERPPQGDKGEELRLQRHQFQRDDGALFHVYLPDTSKVLVKVGDELYGGNVWAEALPLDGYAFNPFGDSMVTRATYVEQWQKQSVRDRWRDLAALCGGGPYVGFCQRLWFEAQGVHPKRRRDLILYPATYVASVVRSVPTAGLWWDLADADKYFVHDLKTYIFPPIPLANWNSLRFPAAGGLVDLNFGIGHPLFSDTFVPPAFSPKPRPGIAPKPQNDAQPVIDPKAVQLGTYGKAELARRQVASVKPGTPRKLGFFTRVGRAVGSVINSALSG